jgi:hypothetical protein
MRTSYGGSARLPSERGPEIYYGYCSRTGRFRMMDLPDYFDNVQQGVSKWMTDTQTALSRGMGTLSWVRPSGSPDCRTGRDDCHCECCVCDADILLQTRCGETRRVPITYENETRRTRPVTLTLDKFVTAGGRDLKWDARLSESQFTLTACGQHTVTVTVEVRCEVAQPSDSNIVVDQTGTVDHCEVGYATLRAEGCTVRPIVIAVAVLPTDCDSYRQPCADCCC